ncbi:MAG: heparinase II/III family protein [Stellaceae bacterium]
MRRNILGPLIFPRKSLVRRTSPGTGLIINQVWPSDPKRGLAIAAGEIELCGILVRNPTPRWFPPGGTEDWYAAWHGFDWIGDLVAAGPAAREEVGKLVQHWLSEQASFRRLLVAWRPDVVGTRLFAWITHLDEIIAGGKDSVLTRAVLTSIAKQYRHLNRATLREVEGAPRLRALKGLIAAAVTLGGSGARAMRALSLLEREMSTQILPDGGHRSRSPSVQLRVLQDLIDIRTVLRAAKLQPSATLTDAIERLAPMLRLFRHGDRRLALFNDSVEEDGVLIDLVLTQSETRGRALSHAPDSGFERLHANKSLIVVDAGTRPPSGFDIHAHAGALSFEMSHDRERIVVNCGAYRGARSNWARVARATAAHSVLVVADTNSTEIREDGVLNRAPMSVTSERAEHEGQQWISGTHDGYRERFGLIYTRELFLAADGDDLRGEDRLVGRPGATFAVRFHLHPLVQASLAEGNVALLHLPSGSRWRLRAAGAEMSLGESIYLGSGEARKTQQVVLSGSAAPGGTTVRWAMRREPHRIGFD